jgi:hypothetical protein
MAASQSMFPGMPTGNQLNFAFDTTSFLLVYGCIGLVVVLVPLYILITQKPAFEKAAALAVE